MWRLVCCALRSALEPYYTTDVWATLASVKAARSFEDFVICIQGYPWYSPYIDSENLVSLKPQGANNLRSSGGILLAFSTFRTKVTLGNSPSRWLRKSYGMLYRVSFAILQTWILLRAILRRTFLSLLMVEWI